MNYLQLLRDGIAKSDKIHATNQATKQREEERVKGSLDAIRKTLEDCIQSTPEFASELESHFIRNATPFREHLHITKLMLVWRGEFGDKFQAGIYLTLVNLGKDLFPRPHIGACVKFLGYRLNTLNYDRFGHSENMDDLVAIFRAPEWRTILTQLADPEHLIPAITTEWAKIGHF